MTRWFGDTYFFLALLNPRDLHHQLAVELSRVNDRSVVTTFWILTELADGLSKRSTRRNFALLYDGLLADPATEIVGESDGWWERGRLLFNARADKDWSLTDCISFEVMRELKITEALTADHHFEQAGFVSLLK